MTDIRQLKQKRTHIKRQVIRIQHYFENTDSPSTAEVRVRLERLREFWNRFEASN